MEETQADYNALFSDWEDSEASQNGDYGSAYGAELQRASINSQQAEAGQCSTVSEPKISLQV